MKLGLIGTGLMGAPIVKKLIDAEFEIGVYNRTASKTAELADYGAKIYSKVFELTKESDVIILMLTNYDSIYNLLFVDNNILFENKTIIQMSTIAPQESRELERSFTKQRGIYFEAPVLGSIPQIKNGELIVLGGGDKSVLDKFDKMFSAFSNKILHIGKVGDASAMKLALNQLIVSETVAFSMSLGYLLENKLDVETFMEILRNSALYAPTFDKKLNNMLTSNFSTPNFPLKHMLKDLDLMLGSFGEEKINTAALKGARKVILDAIEQGYADQDYSALYKGVHRGEKE